MKNWSDMRVSVITINRNNAEGFRRTAMSVSRQQMREHEIEWIVVDGSDVSAEARLAGSGHGTRKPDILILGQASGIYSAMNYGAAACTGDYLIFLNSGDCFSSEGALSCLVKGLVTGEREWAYGAIRKLDADWNASSAFLAAPFSRKKLLLGLQNVPHCATLMSSHMWHELGGFDESIGLAADHDFFVRAAGRHDPEIVFEFITDLQFGGASSRRSIFGVVRDYGRIRKSNEMYATSRLVDNVVSGYLLGRWGFSRALARRRDLVPAGRAK